MTTEPDGSVTRWIGDLVASGATDSATQKLWERYFDRLVHLAHDFGRDRQRLVLLELFVRRRRLLKERHGASKLRR